MPEIQAGATAMLASSRCAPDRSPLVAAGSQFASGRPSPHGRLAQPRIGRMADVDGDTRASQALAFCHIGHLHLDTAEMHAAAGERR
jgi:hypothetical protein